jgi:hypothetical protein
MTTLMCEAREQVGQVAWPEDLRAWLEFGTLEWTVARIVREVCAGERASSGPTSGAEVGTRELLGLLVYAYATGRCDSIGVVEEVIPELESWASREVELDWRRLVWFRRSHRPVLRRCLEEVWRVAYRLHDGRAAIDTTEVPAFEEADGERESWLVVERGIAEEVDRRLRWAVQLDSMALDE